MIGTVAGWRLNQLALWEGKRTWAQAIESDSLTHKARCKAHTSTRTVHTHGGLTGLSRLEVGPEGCDRPAPDGGGCCESRH